MQQSAFYENDTTLAQYLEFHFGERWHGEANFPKALADAAMDAMDGRPLERALDIGCACGRTSFELARYFRHVDGIDFSNAFVGKCREMARDKLVRYARPEEGELVSRQERTLASLGLEEAAGRVAFHQGDACNLEPRFTGYGLVVIASPYTWLEEYTPRDQWVGGFKKNGEDFFTFDGMAEMLAPHFRLLVEPRSLPFVIRETRNKFQHSFSELTVWEKVSR